MVQGAQIAAILAADVLADPNFIEPAILLRPTEGFFNDFGEFVPGAAVENIVSLVSAPASGQERLVLPEGIRDMDVRKFWVANDVLPCGRDCPTLKPSFLAVLARTRTALTVLTRWRQKAHATYTP